MAIILKHGRFDLAPHPSEENPHHQGVFSHLVPDVLKLWKGEREINNIFSCLVFNTVAAQLRAQMCINLNARYNS